MEVDGLRKEIKSSCPEERENIDGDAYPCPMCEFVSNSSDGIVLHCSECHPESDMVHDDELSGRCPVCQCRIESTSSLNDHVTLHFEYQNIPESSDEILALQLYHQELDNAEADSLAKLKERYGLEDTGGYLDQGVLSLNRRYCRNEITFEELHDGKVNLMINDRLGFEDDRYPLKGIIERIRCVSLKTSDVSETLLCPVVDFFYSNDADRGFGCTYRNIQMMISALMCSQPYCKVLYGSRSYHISVLVLFIVSFMDIIISYLKFLHKQNFTVVFDVFEAFNLFFYAAPFTLS
ncbi:unnamed protein product [Soboliphyme baturini]|uniref:Zinc finger-containing ubiquitin peptidase 1 n=1 Tax=Soboliphyme baturini TaxID=241478 RepID=A0A183IWY8_9BILA|nr:unnamed protein product [Soboliphyme baturini]